MYAPDCLTGKQKTRAAAYAATLTKPKFFFVVLLYAAELKKSMGGHQPVGYFYEKFIHGCQQAVSCKKILVTRHPHMQQIMQFCEACISSVSTENSIYNQEIHGNIKKYCSLATSASFRISNYLLQYPCIPGQSSIRAEQMKGGGENSGQGMPRFARRTWNEILDS